MDPVLIAAIVLASLLILVVLILAMCWKLRSKKHNSDIVFTNPISPNHTDDTDRISQAKAKLVEDPFMLNRGTPLKGEAKVKFDNMAHDLQGDRMKFLIILNSLRRDAKHYTPESENFYTYRECIHELSRLLFCINKAPSGVVPEDGLFLVQWAKQILSIYDAERRIIALRYNEDYDGEESPVEGFQIQQLRSSMRARRSSLGTSEGSSLADSQIRVDIETDDEEEEVRTSDERGTPYDDDVIVNHCSLEDERPTNIIAAPPQFSKLHENAGYYN